MEHFSIDVNTISEARIQLHHAVQFLALFNESFLPSQKDYSHTAIRFASDKKCFCSQEQGSIHLELCLKTFSLLIFATTKTVAQLSLSGQTVQKVLLWLKEELAKLDLAFEKTQLPSYSDFPDHSLATIGKFSGNLLSEFAELGGYYNLAQATLCQVKKNNIIRIWPHHFDIAFSINLVNNKLITVGFSPGDTSYDVPYWYVSPWPYPNEDNLPTLGEKAFWHKQGFVAAILKSTDFHSNPAKQSLKFLQEAIDICTKILV